MPPTYMLILLFVVIIAAVCAILAGVAWKRVEELRQKLDDVQETQSNADHGSALARLAGAVAHDLNNLLTVITGHSEILVSDLDAGERKDDAQRILDASVKAGELTSRLLAFSRPGAEVTVPVNVNVILGTIHRMLESIAGENVHLEVLPSPEIPAIQADPNQVERLLIELISFYKSRLARGGKLRLSTRETSIHPVGEGLFDEHGIAVGDYVEIRLTDGGGAAVNPDELFTPQGDDPTGEIARAIAKLSGCVFAENTKGGSGLRTRVLIPIMLESHVTAAPAAAFQRGQGTVLIAEDSDPLRSYVRRALENLGYQVLAARGTEEAMFLFRREANKVDLVIADVMMPGESGLQLSQRLHAMDPNLPILFISGYSSESLEREGLIPMDMPLLTKPFTVEELAGTVQRLLK